jgi:hypothetical protein
MVRQWGIASTTKEPQGVENLVDKKGWGHTLSGRCGT